jgi:periplasmic copper chaperone A
VTTQFDFKAAATLLLCLAMRTPAMADGLANSTAVGNLQISQIWSRPTPPGTSVGAVYLSIQNLGKKADRLVGVSSPAAGKVEIHESRTVQGVMQMRELESLDCPPGAAVKIAPGAFHVMLLGLTQQLVDGAAFDLTLRFRDAGSVTVKVPVENR